MIGLNAPRCYKCKAIDGDKGAVVLEATDLEIVVHRVPVGVSLCTDCAFVTEEQEAEAAVEAEKTALAHREERQTIKSEERLDLEHEAKEFASWSNTFGGW